MFRTVALSLALSALASTVPAHAADKAAASVTPSSRAATAPATIDALTTFPQPAPPPSRGGVLPVLYVSLAGLNAYDTLTTVKGLSQGAVEANGLMRGAAGSPMAMVAVKGGITVGSILVAERLWKSGRRAQAIGMMVASNAMMVVVGARNTNVLRSQR